MHILLSLYQIYENTILEASLLPILKYINLLSQISWVIYPKCLTEP